MIDNPLKWETINAWSARTTGDLEDRYRITVSHLGESPKFLCWVKSDRLGTARASYRPIHHVPDVGHNLHIQDSKGEAMRVCKMHYFQGQRLVG